MIEPSDHLVIVRGGGDLGSGVAWRLSRVGFPVIMLDLERPLAIRRTVAYASAVADGSITVEGIEGRLAGSTGEAIEIAQSRSIAVLAAPELPQSPIPPSVVVDARLAKRTLDTTINQAPLVIALGPGFNAGTDCDAVIETKRGHRLGRVIWNGSAAPNTGVPGEIGGASADRVVRADRDGRLRWEVSFGDIVEPAQPLGRIDDHPVRAMIGGTVRGLLLPGPVTVGLKIGDIDPRLDPDAVNQISDKALAIAGGVLEAVLVGLGISTE